VKVTVTCLSPACHHDRVTTIGAVAGEEARARIRAMVAAQGRVDGVDFVAVV
jgi:hypothetical protein